MNCANHADASAVAYCRTCGKALCANCTRPVRGVIYCEDCLGARMEGTPAGTAGFVSGAAPAAMPPVNAAGAPPTSGGPNPTVAGILGAIPIGIGAVYNGQYAKGLAHLGIFALLVAGCNATGDVVPTISGFGIAFFVLYQIIDSVRSAKAIQAGQPAPDPYGLAATFGGGGKIETGKIPMGAIVLILLGVLFLLHTMGFGLTLDRFWPVILIAIGGWMLARNWGLAGGGCTGCQCARCRSRRLMGPAMLLTIGVLLQLETLHVGNFGFGRTWPVILLVVGAVKLLQGSASTERHVARIVGGTNAAGGPVPPTPPVPPEPPVPPTSEVHHG
jgi:Domain of unknown function (DUF5668)/B-box zinc finger